MASLVNVLDAYAPNVNVECPDLSRTSLLRIFSPQNQTLHPSEVEYISDRASNVIPAAWADWLGDGSRIGYNFTNFNSSTYPKIGMAIPGGGLRAAFIGASCMNGLDARNDSAKSAGTGGLLQVTSYIAGLSGGSWVLGSLFFNNFPTMHELVNGNGQDSDGWLLDIPLVTPDGDDIASAKNQQFYGSILASVLAKALKGIDTSLTDPWSRLISYHFLNQTSRQNIFTNDTGHGAGQLWSNIPLLPVYQQHQVPFPIAFTNSRPVGSSSTASLPPDAIVYEITPFEIASYDPNLSIGMNLTYAGTHLINGKPVNGSACVTAFDQAGFIMGSSASLFNQILDFAQNTLSQFSGQDSSGLLFLLRQQLAEVRTRADDVANWPNPFQGQKGDTFEDSDSNYIELIDGSSNQENVPFGPLLVKARGIDVIVTLEGSADTPENWPNGSSLIQTAARQMALLQASHQPLPPIPATVSDFLSTGVNMRPTFFGCDPQTPTDFPLVIYLPNAPPITGAGPVTNTPTFKLSYSTKHIPLFFEQVHFATISGFTPFANTPDHNFGTCLQCAAFDRARLKVAPVVPRSTQCTACFKQYCFDPLNPPSVAELPGRRLGFVDPDPPDLLGFFEANKFKLIGGLIGLVVFIALVVGGLFWREKRKKRRHMYKSLESPGSGIFLTPLRKQEPFEAHGLQFEPLVLPASER